jgi:FAD binding domain/Aromatic-ring hydroxylase, C-terminal
MTLDELRASIRRVNGRDLPITGTRWVSRFTDFSRQAARYRAGRVLLAGDAAHIHLPAGGPGLNTSLQDAVNLGWKLAAEVRGWAPPGLLDTYHTERHAKGERVLLHTRAQGALIGSGGDERVAALREVLRQLLQYEQPQRHLVSLMYALDTRYDIGTADPHPLAGRWAPDLALTTPTGASTVAELLHPARGVLLDLTENGSLAGNGHGWADKVDIVAAHCTAPRTAALLIRPRRIRGLGDSLGRPGQRWAAPRSHHLVRRPERWPRNAFRPQGAFARRGRRGPHPDRWPTCLLGAADRCVSDQLAGCACPGRRRCS